MGLFDFIREEFIDVIDWVDNTPDTLLWKFPDKGNKIMNGAQLTVRESQVAVLINEGQFGDVYTPGRHLLSTQNMPITTTLSSWKYAFESPFKVDVYFVNTRQHSGLRWGTAGPILMRDPQFGQVRTKAFGSYAIRVSDPQLFIRAFAGTAPWLRVSDVEDRLRQAITSRLTEGLAEAGVSVLDLAGHFSEIGESLKPLFAAEFAGWGITLEKFFIENVSLPEEVERMIDKSTSVNVLEGKLTQFNQMQAGLAIENMSNNEGAAQTAGIGMGMLVNGMMQGMAQPGNTAGATNGASRSELLDTLKQLGELQKAGVLTQEEFDTKKADILSRL